MRTIGLTGRAGVGKDTVADYLVANHGFRKYSLAGPLKEMLKVIGVDCDNRETKELPHPVFGVSPRRMAQTLGTEWMRDCVATDGWLRVADRYVEEIRRVNAHNDDQTYCEGVVFSDVRFENEAEFIRERGTLIHVLRDVAAVEAHPSEVGIKFRIEGDRCLLNDKAIEVTFRRLEDILGDL
jgi:hypothetical protein